MKFKIGQIVKHKISNEEYVIIHIRSPNWLRNTATFVCRTGNKRLNLEMEDEFLFKGCELKQSKDVPK